MVKQRLIIFAAGLILGLLCGFFAAKGMYDRPFDESVKRDTVTLHDTLPYIDPTPKDSAHVKWLVKWLPKAVHDTIIGENYAQNPVEIMHDTIAVQVPITSKHYGSKEYDAWISGYEASLDSIKVYRETQVITETITRMKPPNKWELNVVGGINYNTAQKEYMPYALGELLYKPNRLQVGLQGGVVKRGEKVEPFVGVQGKVRIL